METMLQGLVIIGGLTFSLAAALLIEELIFGRIVRLAFAPRPDEFSVPSSQEPHRKIRWGKHKPVDRNRTGNQKLRTEN